MGVDIFNEYEQAVEDRSRNNNGVTSVGQLIINPPKTAQNNDRMFVSHNYHDRSHVDEDDTPVLVRQRRRKRNPFPIKLHQVLDRTEAENLTHIVAWKSHGRCFVILQPKEFVATVLPRFFKQSKLTSFQRQLSLYGFQRLTRGPDAGGYYNEFFLRGKPFLSKHMRRETVKGTRIKPASNPDHEPNFYTMPSVNERTPQSLQQQQQQNGLPSSSASQVSFSSNSNPASSNNGSAASASIKLEPLPVQSVATTTSMLCNYSSLHKNNNSNCSNQHQQQTADTTGSSPRRVSNNMSLLLSPATYEASSSSALLAHHENNLRSQRQHHQVQQHQLAASARTPDYLVSSSSTQQEANDDFGASFFPVDCHQQHQFSAASHTAPTPEPTSSHYGTCYNNNGNSSHHHHQYSNMQDTCNAFQQPDRSTNGRGDDVLDSLVDEIFCGDEQQQPQYQVGQVRSSNGHHQEQQQQQFQQQNEMDHLLKSMIEEV